MYNIRHAIYLWHAEFQHAHSVFSGWVREHWWIDAYKYRIAHSGRLCRSTQREQKGFEDSREVGEVFFLFLFFLSPEYGRAHARASNSSSINTRGSVVTFWLCVWAEGRVCCCGAQLGGSFVPPGEAQCGGAQLNMVKKRPRTMHMGDGAGQLRISYFYLQIFRSCDSLCLSTFFVSVFLTAYSLLLLFSSISLFLLFCRRGVWLPGCTRKNEGKRGQS